MCHFSEISMSSLIVFVYRLEVGALEAMSVVHEPRIWVAKERLGESEQAATAEV
jgi:hypothetical protein